MNPAYNKTLNLLVEILGRHHTPPRSTSTNRGLVGGFPTSTVRKPTKRSKRFDPEAEDVKKKMFGGARASYSRSTDPQQEPTDDTSADQRIPPPLKGQDSKKESFFKRMLGAFMKKFGSNKKPSA